MKEAPVVPAPQTWARYAPATGLSTLFRPLRKNGVRPKLNVIHRHGDRLELRFSAANALGIPEQTLLLAILNIAGEVLLHHGACRVLDADCADGVGAVLWSALFPDGAWEGAQSLRIETSWLDLNRRTGNQPGGSANAARRQSLVWLCEVVVWEREFDTGQTRQSYLVRWLTGDDHRIHLALNPRLAASFLGSQYALVSMTERLQLRSDLAMAVHAFVSTAVRQGHQLHIRPQTLAARLWPDSDSRATAGTMRRRIGAVVRALGAIGQLPGWRVGWDAAGVATVHRLTAFPKFEPSRRRAEVACDALAWPRIAAQCSDDAAPVLDVSTLLS